MIRRGLILAAMLAIAFVPISHQPRGIVVGSKAFTESVILGEILAHLIQGLNEPRTRDLELGGTQMVFQALVNGDIHVYPDYTGTIIKEILAGEDIQNDDDMRAALESRGVLMSRPLGFNNRYAIGMLKETAGRLGINRISDLVAHPDLRFGFSSEFMERKDDGWGPLRRHYHLPQKSVVGMEHDLAYQQLRHGAIDAIDVYTTDAKIQTLDLAVLEDDLDFFPRYDAVILYRADLQQDKPHVVQTILKLENAIDELSMQRLNRRVEVEQIAEIKVAAEFLANQLSTAIDPDLIQEPTVPQRIWGRTIEHFDMVRKSLIPAILLAIPLGIIAAKRRYLGQFILGSTGIVQTIPALALLTLFIPIVNYFGLRGVGLGTATAVVALFLYSLLPIVRGTVSGLQSISGEHNESAAALGLPSLFRIFRIELPLASRSILSGIKIAAVINVGFATLGALIGAGGYGAPIVSGLRLARDDLILQGAIPAAVMALAVTGLFDLSERIFVPRGLRLNDSA